MYVCAASIITCFAKLCDLLISLVPFSLRTLTLIKWEDDSGVKKRFHLIDRVSNHFNGFGYRLQIEPNRLESWRHQYLGDPTKCFLKVMEHWFATGSDEYPTTWEGMYELLEDTKLFQVARDLREAVSSAIEPSGTEITCIHATTMRVQGEAVNQE
jgi:hypothetical protein